MYENRNIKPKFHVVPKSGFLNDPNGLVQFKGVYHAFFQWLEEVTPQGSKCWAHCTSTDLIHWENKGIALKPDKWYDKNGCYSGNAIVFNEKIYLFYTGNVRTENGDRQTYQCLATSEDGITFIKHGPVVHLPEGYTTHFRDPKVWKDEKENLWYMIVGAQTSELKGNVALFWSNDLFNWNYKGRLLPETMNWGYMCECPDLIRFENKYILVVSRQEKVVENGIEKDNCNAVWMSGNFLKDRGVFIPNSNERRLDEGFDFYAPQSFIDEKNRILYMAWLGGGDYDYQMSQPAIKEGWIHSFTYPRELIFKDNLLYQKPANELETLRDKEVKINVENRTIVFELSSLWNYSHEDLCQEIKINLEEENDFNCSIRGTLKLLYDSNKKIVKIKRFNWLKKKFDEKLIDIGNRLKTVNIFIDNSAVEIFINEGINAISIRDYSKEDNIKITSIGRLKLHIWSYKEENSNE